mgnify:CR=1 FL=1|jgi:hypothetical protein|tara:strand:+ start:2235 stop:3764 length:1530 start_codon:yes stop_codon:yes gene_type:complete
MDLDITKLPCVDQNTKEKFTIDLTAEDMAGKCWTLELPLGIEGHELVSCTEVHRGGYSKHRDINESITSMSFFIPTPGRSEMHDGSPKVTWEFHPQHLDFMIAYFDGLDQGIIDRPLVINFCDESPKLEQCIPQLFSCMQMFDIHPSKVIILGQNFDGQEIINQYAKKENTDPVQYVVNWNMHGHLDTHKLEEAVDGIGSSYAAVNGAMQISKSEYSHIPFKDTYWETVKNSTFTFLNRRFSESRLVALWALYLADTWKYKSIVSAFPPQIFHKIGKADGIGQFFIEDYFRTVLTKRAPMMRNQLTPSTFKEFTKQYRIGESLPGDHPYIGAIESKYAPNMENSYIWYTCETVADHENTNTFFTEKVLKPMVYGQGLMLAGQQGMIKKFKQLGFHTLAEELGFSEAYDDEPDYEKRVKMISAELSKLCQVPLLEMHERWLTARDKIIENRKRMACQLTNIDGNYWDNLCKFTNSKIKEQYDADKLREQTTEDVFKVYQNMFYLEQFVDN